MRIKLKKRYLLLLVLMPILFYLFWGPLFPWNPIKIGYKKIISSKAIIYITDMTERDSVVYRIDALIQEEEKFFDLKYVDNFKIIILNKDSNMRRYLPWLKGSGYSVSLSLANLIYIGPMARKSPAGIEPYLKHELSHLLIGQNTSFKKAGMIHEQGWFAEGIAEYFSGRSFYSKDKLKELVKKDNPTINDLLDKNPLNMSFSEIKLHYSYNRFFIEFLVDTYGMRKFRHYLKKYINNPKAYKILFFDIYRVDFDESLKNFYSTLTE